MAHARVIRIRLIEGPNALDQIALCAFHAFLLEFQTKLATLCGDVFEQHARYTMRYQESDLHLAFILLNLLTLPLFH